MAQNTYFPIEEETLPDQDVFEELADEEPSEEDIRRAEIELEQENSKDSYNGPIPSSIEMVIDSIDGKPFLTQEQERDYAKQYRGTPEERKNAIDAFVMHNYKYIVKIAKRYSYNKNDLEDNVQNGILGLMKAIEKFDPDKGFRFITYASKWIEQNIRREIANTGRTIRLPVNITDKIFKINKAERLINMDGITPDISLLCEYTGMQESEVTEILSLRDKVTSLNKMVGTDDQDTELIDFISDDNAETPESHLFSSELNDALMEIFDQGLNDREKNILIRRLGLDGKPPATLDAIGKDEKVTRQRIRQLEEKAYRKLRNPKYKKILRRFL